MSVVEYRNDSKTGRNLSVAAATLLLVTGTAVSYASEIFGEVESPTTFVKVNNSLVFDLKQSVITEYGRVESSPYMDEEEVRIELKMPPIKSYKRKATISKRIHATPMVEISGLV